MKVHKIIDAFRNKPTDYRMAVPEVDPGMRLPFLDWMNNAAQQLDDSQHFVFENVPIEMGGGEMSLPGVTKEEQDIFSMGLLPLPFEKTWFESPSADGSEFLCYLLEEIDNGFVVTPMRVIESRMQVIQVTGEQWTVRYGTPGETPPTIDLYDQFGGGAILEEAQNSFLKDGPDQKTIVKGEIGFVLYLLLMLSSKTTEIRETPAPHKINKKRSARGKAPIPSHRVVSIIPRKAVAEYRRQENEQAASRSSPRIHWRRSHIRQLQNGKTTVVARALIGYRTDPERETVTHSYKVKL